MELYSNEYYEARDEIIGSLTIDQAHEILKDLYSCLVEDRIRDYQYAGAEGARPAWASLKPVYDNPHFFHGFHHESLREDKRRASATGKMYRVQATITDSAYGWTCTRQVSTFYLSANTQGIVNCEHAREIAVEMLMPIHGNASISVEVCEA